MQSEQDSENRKRSRSPSPGVGETKDDPPSPGAGETQDPDPPSDSPPQPKRARSWSWWSLVPTLWSSVQTFAASLFSPAAPAPPTAANVRESLAALSFTLADTDKLRVSTHNNYMAEAFKFQDRTNPLKETLSVWSDNRDNRANGNNERLNAHVFTYGPPGTGKSRFMCELCLMSDDDATKLIEDEELRRQFIDGIRIMVSFNDSTDLGHDDRLELGGEARLALRVLHAMFARETKLRRFAKALDARLSLGELELHTALEVVRAAAGDVQRPVFLMVDELVRPQTSRRADDPVDDTRDIVNALAYQLDDEWPFYHISSSLQVVAFPAHHTGSGRIVQWVNMVALEHVDFVMEALQDLNLADWGNAGVQQSMERLLLDCCGQPRALEVVYLAAKKLQITDFARLRWAVIEGIRKRYTPNWGVARAVFPLVVKQQMVRWRDEIVPDTTYATAASAGFLMNTSVPDAAGSDVVTPVVLPLWLLAAIPKVDSLEAKQLHCRIRTAIELLFPSQEHWQTFEYRTAAWCAVRRYMAAMELGDDQRLDLLSPFRENDGQGKLLGRHNLDESAWTVPAPEPRENLLNRIGPVPRQRAVMPVPVPLGAYAMPPDNTRGADAIAVFDGAMVLEQSKFTDGDATLAPSVVVHSIRQQTALLTGSSEPECKEHEMEIFNKDGELVNVVWDENARVMSPLPEKRGGLLPGPDDDTVQMNVDDKAVYIGPAAEAAARLETNNVLHVVLSKRRVTHREEPPRNVLVVGREELDQLQGESLRFRDGREPRMPSAEQAQD